MRDLCQLGDGWFLVDELVSVQVAELCAEEPDPEVGAEHALPFLREICLNIINFWWWFYLLH